MAGFLDRGIVPARMQLLAAFRNQTPGAHSGPAEGWCHVTQQHGMLWFRVECSASGDTGATASRAGFMLASLLPVLLLVASGHQIIVPATGGTGARPCILAAAGSSDHHHPLELRRGEQMARRRAGTPFGPGGFPTAIPSLASRTIELGRLEFSSIDTDGPLGLAKCWQFHWRTALEPRAPSSVS
jgi:hypothetical protein